MNTDPSARKGELADLKAQLRQLAGSKQPGVETLKRELFSKVISYMTIGIDVSSLFSTIVMCSATSDLVLKKMCYLYVGNYARGHPDLALLTINFLQKDCHDEDPMIRGLALRSLCSLRVKNLLEYLIGPLRSGLKDANGYVRTVAAMGVLKLYRIAPSQCTENEFPAMLRALLLNDPDAQVVANCLCALQEIYAAEANVAPEVATRDREHLMSKPVIYSLLNRIKDFTEWSQCLVLDMVSKYIPSDSDESFDMMNILEDRLQHTNSAVVLATIKVFLHLTLSMADIHQQVYERIKAPLLTLVNSGGAEQTYAVLSHLHLLVLRAPVLFSNDYKHFYCRYSDPSYVKKLKLEMLTAVANETNTYEIVTELTEYAGNVDVAIARESIRAVGKIALQQYDVNAIVDRLLQFLEMEKDYVTAETLVLVKDLLRKYPQWSHDCIAVVGSVSSKTVTEPKAKSALVWMLGEYAYDMPDAPYILEGFIENWMEEDSAEVRLELLTAVTKIFFKRPPESIKMLGAALSAGLADVHQDVHDRALLYYRLLQQGVEVAERVVNPTKQAVSVFADTQSSEIKDRIFDEFNSLSVVYQQEMGIPDGAAGNVQPSYMFLDKEVRGPIELADDSGLLPMGPTIADDDVLPSQLVDATDNDLLLSASDKEESVAAASNGSHYSGPDLGGIESSSVAAPRLQSSSSSTTTSQATPAASAAAPTSLLDFEDLLGLKNTTEASTPAPTSLKLKVKPSLVAQAFQRKWGQLAVASTLDFTLSSPAALPTPQPLISHMQANLVEVMASGGKAPAFKFFFYAQAADSPPTSGFFLVELVVNTSTGHSQAKIKADDASLAPPFQELFRAILSSFGSV